MAILTWCLYLVVTLLILYPAVLITAASIFALYFKYKAEHIAKISKAFGDAALEIVKKSQVASMKKE